MEHGVSHETVRTGPAEARSAPQTVVLFGSYAPSLINFRGRLITAMAERGHRVFAVAPEITEDLAGELRQLGSTPISVPLGRTSLNPLGNRASRLVLEEQLRRIRPDVVIAYTIKPIVLGALAARTAKVPRFVAMVTGMGYPFLGGFHPKRVLIRLVAMAMYRRALRLSSFVIFQNPDDRRDFHRLGLLPRRAPTGIVNGSGVDVDHFAQRALPEETSFLMIARFLRDKGIREFAEASRRLKARYPNIRIKLVGWRDESPDSISQGELDAMARSGIECLGQLDDVRPALSDCSVYVLPSYREGTPRSVLEAMAVGRAIITTDAPGCRETVVDGRNGTLVPVQDADALFVAMRDLVEHPARIQAMGEASRRLAEDRYDVRKVNEAVLEFAGL